MGTVETQRAALGDDHAEICTQIYSFVNSMALKCAVDLRIADIIRSHGGPMTLSEIASCIDSPLIPVISSLGRIMRLLVRNKIFTAHHSSSGEEIRYGLNNLSKWLLRDSDTSLAPLLLMELYPTTWAPWHRLSQCVKEGGIAFNKVYGCDVWDFASQNPEFNKIFNDGMACTAKILAGMILAGNEDGFHGIKSLVDVGGGTGGMIAEIVKSYPHIKGINFDLPHVIATAPMHDGVSHVGGNMFQAIPNADAILMKSILHDWNDEGCVKILKNCRQALISKNSGKVIIVDTVLEPEGNSGSNDDLGMVIDVVMMTHTGGKERTELEWKKTLEKAGFPRYKIINIPTFSSIIEAYPQ